MENKDKKVSQEEKIEFLMTKLTLDTYNKIALWNNGDYDSKEQKGNALKIVAQDVVQNALEQLLSGIDVKTNTEVFRGDAKIGENQIVKDENSFQEVDEKDVLSKLFNK